MVRLERSIAKKIEELDLKINQSSKRDSAQDKELKQQVYSVMKTTRDKLDSVEIALRKVNSMCHNQDTKGRVFS